MPYPPKAAQRAVPQDEPVRTGRNDSTQFERSPAGAVHHLATHLMNPRRFLIGLGWFSLHIACAVCCVVFATSEKKPLSESGFPRLMQPVEIAPGTGDGHFPKSNPDLSRGWMLVYPTWPPRIAAMIER
jgi:hypothetical protein